MDGNLEALRIYEIEQAKQEQEQEDFERTGLTKWQRKEVAEEIRWEQGRDRKLEIEYEN